MTKSTTRQAADVAQVVGRKNLIINGTNLWQQVITTVKTLYLKETTNG